MERYHGILYCNRLACYIIPFKGLLACDEHSLRIIPNVARLSETRKPLAKPWRRVLTYKLSDGVGRFDMCGEIPADLQAGVAVLGVSTSVNTFLLMVENRKAADHNRPFRAIRLAPACLLVIRCIRQSHQHVLICSQNNVLTALQHPSAMVMSHPSRICSLL